MDNIFIDYLTQYVTQEELERFEELAQANDSNTANEISKFVKQYILFQRIPFNIYEEDVDFEEPSILNFTKHPLYLIHPLKRAAVEEILLSDIPDTIEKIIIFGSAVRVDCRKNSDIDICIVGSYRLHDEDSKPWFKKLTKIGPKDLKFYTQAQLDENTGIRKDINEKGVVIYERKLESC